MEILYANILDITWQQVVMWAIGGVLIYLAIKKDMEPSLLLPMGFGQGPGQAYNWGHNFQELGFEGGVSFGLSVAGVAIGHRFGVKFKSKAEFAGGLVLVLIGLKILLEHLGVIAF